MTSIEEHENTDRMVRYGDEPDLRYWTKFDSVVAVLIFLEILYVGLFIYKKLTI